MNMENVELHTEKVKILSRLIKESSLTLEEALLLLKEEEKEEQKIEEPIPNYSGYIYTGSIGTGTTTPSNRMTITSSGGTSFSSTTSNSILTNDLVDLNN